MKPIRWIQGLFGLAALYDGLLGLVFLLVPWWVFQSLEITPPNHWGYVQFPAALLIIFGLMFLAIARAPRKNRNLIPYGIGLKIAYCAIAGYWWAAAGIPFVWKLFAAFDLAMVVLFVGALVTLRGGPPAPAPDS